MYRTISLSVLSLLASLAAQDAVVYRRPPAPIDALLTAEPPPALTLSPCCRHIVLQFEQAMPDLEVLARPHRKLAGLRLDSATPGPQLDTKTTRVVLRSFPGLLEREIALPIGHLSGPVFNATGTHAAFSRTTDRTIELWLLETETAQVRLVPGVALNMVLGSAIEWSRDQQSLLCMLAVDAALPTQPKTPSGPNVQETKAGEKARVRTNQDMLQNEYDAQCFALLATRQLARVDRTTLAVEKLGLPSMLTNVSQSPDGEMLLVSHVQRPFSYQVSVRDFPRRYEIWNQNGTLVRVFRETPLSETVPIGGVPTGMRSLSWLEGQSHALRWFEAQDEGDPRTKVSIRDHVYVQKEPTSEPQLWFSTEHRAMSLVTAEDGRLALVTEIDRAARRQRVWRVDPSDLNQRPALVYERSLQDVYGDPGMPIEGKRPDGRRLLRQRGAHLFLTGRGASPSGERPFLVSFDPVTVTTVRLWQCAEGRYETFVGFLDDDRIVIRSESPQDAPNYAIVVLATGARTPLTTFQDPALELSKSVSRELLLYQRSDGVALSATLYLPPGHQPGEKHPTLVWAYPQEFTRAADAGQVRSAPMRYTRFAGTSHLWLLLAGYAVLDDTAMPIVGPVMGANDTYIAQLVDDAKSAVDLLVLRGICEPHQIAVGGHSYGAFMAANLLCHTDLFATAIARSGAYNRTLTPFGFQNEERTFWEAPEVYLAMSPFAHADKLDEPILLIHGEDDDNQGTWPLQSQRLFAAIKGHGGQARLCMLPHEAHAYRARESVLHCVWEMVDWMDRKVKNRAPRAPAEKAAAVPTKTDDGGR
ncbi:MAG: prolyl oligopeptidase family serine peptidase [Planctomycetota bacterium]